ncbi:hypothetical protein HYU07_07070 [Candidatus Woesearchaeota archaeon]|nr:hypothetical protein [Candidatus Woesearchaeota archaeon]
MALFSFISSVSLTNSSSNSAFSAALKFLSISVLWNFLIVIFVICKAGIVSLTAVSFVMFCSIEILETLAETCSNTV